MLNQLTIKSQHSSPADSNTTLVNVKLKQQVHVLNAVQDSNTTLVNVK